MSNIVCLRINSIAKLANTDPILSRAGFFMEETGILINHLIFCMSEGKTMGIGFLKFLW